MCVLCIFCGIHNSNQNTHQGIFWRKSGFPEGSPMQREYGKQALGALLTAREWLMLRTETKTPCQPTKPVHMDKEAVVHIWNGIFLLFFSRQVVSNSLLPHGLQHARPPCPSPTPKFTQTHVHWVGDAIQPSHRLLSPSPPTFSLSQHQGLFQRVSCSLSSPSPPALQYLRHLMRIEWNITQPLKEMDLSQL